MEVSISHFNQLYEQSLNDALLRQSSKTKKVYQTNSPSASAAVYDCSGWRELLTGWSIPVGPYPVYLLPKHRPLLTEDNLTTLLKQKIDGTGLINSKYSKGLVNRSADTYSPVNSRRTPLTFLTFHGSVETGTCRYIADNGKYRAYKKFVKMASYKALADSQFEVQHHQQHGPDQDHETTRDQLLQDGSRKNYRLKRLDKTIFYTGPPSDSALAPEALHTDSTNDSFLSCRSVPIGNSLICLPPLEIPLISLSFDYRKIAKKVSLWEDSLQRDLQHRTGSNTTTNSTTSDSCADDGFSIKSILHNCSLECDCSRYPERQRLDPNGCGVDVAPRQLSKHGPRGQRARPKALGGHRGGLTAAITAIRWTTTTTVPQPSTSRGTDDGKTATVAAMLDAGHQSESDHYQLETTSGGDGVNGPLSPETSTASGFCSSALGQPKVRQTRSIPSIPNPKPESGRKAKSVELTGQGLPYLSYTHLVEPPNQ